MWVLALLLLMAASLSDEERLAGIAGVFGIVLGIGLVALFGVLYALCRDVDSRDSTT
jgi:succinate-acetate transporter protein